MENQPLRAVGPADLPDVVNALGTRSFGPRMAAHADAMFGGHVCFAYHYYAGTMTALAAGHVPEDSTNVLVPNTWRYTQGREWEHDACLARGMSPLDHQTLFTAFHDRGGVESKRHWPWQIPTPLVDKILLCQHHTQGTFVLEFSRWGDCCDFDVQGAGQAVHVGRLLMSLVAVHHRLLLARQDPLGAFRSSENVQRCLAKTTTLAPRERQVCSLQILGASVAAIASELGIEAESVKSYRKRAYLRLGVSCERELMLKYLSLRTQWRDDCNGLMSSHDPWLLPFLSANAN
jgi:DNA-binding CsgD family transcriptional regulator